MQRVHRGKKWINQSLDTTDSPRGQGGAKVESVPELKKKAVRGILDSRLATIRIIDFRIRHKILDFSVRRLTSRIQHSHHSSLECSTGSLDGTCNAPGSERIPDS